MKKTDKTYFKYEYKIKNDIYTLMSTIWPDGYMESVAEEAAYKYYENTDFDSSEWPITLTVLFEGKEVGKFKVEYEWEPEFYATKCK